MFSFENLIKQISDIYCPDTLFFLKNAKRQYIYVNKNADEFYYKTGYIKKGTSLIGLQDIELYKNNMELLSKIHLHDRHVIETGKNVENHEIMLNLNSNFNLQFYSQRWRLQDDNGDFYVLSNCKEYSSILIGNKEIKLSKRQTEVFAATYIGLSSKKIGKEIGISFRTVEIFISQIRDKFGIQNKNQIHQIVLDNNLSDAMQYVYRNINDE